MAASISVTRGRSISQLSLSSQGSNISSSQLKENLSSLEVRADRMLERLTLEANLAMMLWKFPTFCACMVCFMVALCEFIPPRSMYNVNRRIESHFGLEKIQEIKDYKSIYDFMEEFEGKNRELQATSTKYWCEGRYVKLRWDDHLLAPVWECRSPRQYALSLLDDPGSSWSHLRSPASSSSGSSHRRMAGSSGGGSSSSSSTCEDNDAGLQEEEANPNITCANFAHHACEIELGVLLCPKTCGFCGPFQYESHRRFGHSQLTMLPTMVFQTRFQTDECHNFAHTYEMQPHNPVLTLLPALDGVRKGRVLTCIDRTEELNDDYAFELDCPEGSPEKHCRNGTLKVTEKHTFHGVPIYPKLLMEPHRDVEAMRASNWLDLQTGTVTLSTAIFTEGMDIFTSLSVVFRVDEAGNVDGMPELISYRDLTGGAKRSFIVGLVACATISLCGVVLAFLQLKFHPEHRKCGVVAYELFAYGVWLAYVLALLISWSQQVPMPVEFDHLLHSFLDMTSVEHEDLEHAVQVYFDVKTHLYKETNWLMAHRIFSYFVWYIQFIHLICIFSAHPKVAMITATFMQAMSNITHFLTIFGIIFTMLAFLAHWLLGGHIMLFGSLEASLRTQMRMIFGIYIEVDGAGDLQGALLGVYWFYAGIFLLVIWLTCLNMFLAIILKTFVKVKADVSAREIARDFPTDVIGVIHAKFLRMRYRWPSNEQFVKYFRAAAESASTGSRAAQLTSHLRAGGVAVGAARKDRPDEQREWGELQEGLGEGTAQKPGLGQPQEGPHGGNAGKASCADHPGELDGQYSGEVVVPFGGFGLPTQVKEGSALFGVPIYPKLLIEPHRDFAAMKAVEWLDLQYEGTQSAESSGSKEAAARSGPRPNVQGQQDEPWEDAGGRAAKRPGFGEPRETEDGSGDAASSTDQPDAQTEPNVGDPASQKPGRVWPESLLVAFHGQLSPETLAQFLYHYCEKTPRLLAHRDRNARAACEVPPAPPGRKVHSI